MSSIFSDIQAAEKIIRDNLQKACEEVIAIHEGGLKDNSGTSILKQAEEKISWMDARGLVVVDMVARAAMKTIAKRKLD